VEDDFENWLSERSDDVPDAGRELAPGTAVGDYRIVALLGSGGFADVYRAQDASGSAVAMKILHRLDEKSRVRFAHESKILSQIRHANIPRLLDFGSYGDRPYMVTELLKPYELPTSDRKVAEFLLQVISAAAELHRHGYVHRDIKPSNILLDDAGDPILADPGPTGGGTREWAAPEQLSLAQDIGAAADFHALGLVLYRALTGELPPPRGVLPSAIEPPPGTLPRNLDPRPSRGWESLLIALLNPSPEERLADIGKIKVSLMRLRRREGARTFAKRFARPVLIGLATLVIALVAAPRARCPRSQGGRDEARPRGQDARVPRAAATSAATRARCPRSQGSRDEARQERAIHKEWARQYANSLTNLLAKVLESPVLNSEGRIVVPDGKVLLSGDIPESSPNAEIVLDGGVLRFSPSAKALEKIAGRCEDFIANAPAGVPVPEDFLPTIRGRFVQRIAVTAKGGELNTADGVISVFVAGPVACDENADGATLNIIGFSGIILNRDSLDPRLKITGCGQIAELGADGRIIRRRWFDYDNPL
jgi:hypothetical protein